MLQTGSKYRWKCVFVCMLYVWVCAHGYRSRMRDEMKGLCKDYDDANTHGSSSQRTTT